MLTLTQGAADVAEAIVANTQESAVLRITSRTHSENGGGPTELEVIVAGEPEETDVLVDGMPVAVDPLTLEYLSDKVLDAEIDGAEVTFSIYRQPEETT